jgi:hypothetical protein
VETLSVNTFDDEDGMSAAYDAAERALWYAIDAGTLRIDRFGVTVDSETAHKEVRELARRIADAVIHSSAEDIAEMGLGVTIERVTRRE